MNLRDLQYLIAVAETHHFGKAAERCFVSQPTLSGQIKKLEQELGITIFERTNRSVEITPAGAQILDHARLIMEQADAIRQLAQSYQDPVAGPLRVGAIPTISPYLMPLILQPLQHEHPQMRLVISEEQTDTLLQRLHHHEIDAAILATEHTDNDFDVIPLYREPFWLAHPQKHPFYTKEEITQQDLDDSELLLLAEGHCLAQQAMELCHLQNRPQQQDMANLRASSLETLMQLVAAGYGTTLVPALALTGSWVSGRGVITRELDLPNSWRQISLYYRRSFPRQQALQALAEIIKLNLPNTVEVL
ncbi:MAG: LysR substrate-binding domain-containing protein [Gammaproteobacteria bacterium]|nr:LysR substrate-binding domain-containing protein [Gammaproteobacteria bacterium]